MGWIPSSLGTDKLFTLADCGYRAENSQFGSAGETWALQGVSIS